MTKRTAFYCIILALSVIFMDACATTELRSVWHNESYQHGPLKKILVIGVDRKQEMRRLLEDEFTIQLKAKGVEAVPAHTVLSEDAIIEKKIISAKVSELGIDSVLITTLIDVGDTEGYESPTFYAPTGFYGYYMQCCYSVALGYNVEIETRIFDARDDVLLWSALSETVLERAPEMTIQSYIDAIVNELQKTELLGP